ncbi:MAG TPA: class I SAM-dependent methyltransferase [Jiangellales bacterium]|nr:class I SAM-dependent methyltransferase [Jiangellales bacterium]
MLDRLRTGARDKLVRVVEEVVGREVADLRRHVDAAAAEAARRDGELREQVSELRQALDDLQRRQRRDLDVAMDWQAAHSTVDFISAELPPVVVTGHAHDTLRHGLAHAPEDGMALEFGVATGTTLGIIVEARKGGQVFGFDSFAGLPETWRSRFEAGEFARDEIPRVEGAELVVGLFSDTLPGFLAEHEGPVAFLHLDADLYSSTRTVLEQVGPRLVAGTVVVFDEYFNYPGWQEHEHKAWREHVERTGLEFEYLAYTHDDEQLVIRVTSTGGG